jgi:NAD(P)-dependent dehydrogenase (short-subunit alcohol dehydrogenase family)
MSFQHVLVMGASGGIGLAIAQKLAADPALQTLVLCAAHANASEPLRALQQQCAARHIATLLIDTDISDENSLATMAVALSAQSTSLDLVVNAAGLLHAPDLLPEKTITQVSTASMQRIFSVNAFGPILLMKTLWPWLRAKRPVVFASLSARVGSIEDNQLGGWFSYRAAKAAQNQFLKTGAIELSRINPQSIVLALHPGTTDTGLSQPFQANVKPDKLFTPAFVAERLFNIIQNASPADSGSFIAWDGKRIKW